MELPLGLPIGPDSADLFVPAKGGAAKWVVRLRFYRPCPASDQRLAVVTVTSLASGRFIDRIYTGCFLINVPPSRVITHSSNNSSFTLAWPACLQLQSMSKAPLPVY